MRRITVNNPESEISVLCGIGLLHRVRGSERYSMRYRVVHHTEHRYVQPVAFCHNETHLNPGGSAPALPLARGRDGPWSQIISEREDFFGNPTASFHAARP